MNLRTTSFIVIAALALGTAATGQDFEDSALRAVDQAESPSRLPDQPIPLVSEEAITPTPLLTLFGPGLLETGPLGSGFELPTGAVWRPSLWIFGTLRTGFNNIDDPSANPNVPDGPEITEWVNRLDLFANLQLSATERILLGIEPLHDAPKFSGYRFHPRDDDGWVNGTNLDIATLFFEGDFGEIFPFLDPHDRLPLDVGFSVGRWLLDLQDGMLANDRIDAVGLTRYFPVPGTSTTRVTLLYGWNHIDRGDGRRARQANLAGISLEADTYSRTLEADLVWVDAPDSQGGDGIYAAIGSVQRIAAFGRTWNSTVRAMLSQALDGSGPQVGNGALFFSELSITPRKTMDTAYLNFFIGIDDFTSAARGPTKGGPLGRTGLLFAAVGLGAYQPALGNQAQNSVGGSVGYQWMFDQGKRNLVLEAGGRGALSGSERARGAIGGRFQQKLADRIMLELDAYGLVQEGGETGHGLHAELVFKL